MPKVRNVDLTPWEAESAYRFLEVWEKDEDSRKYLMALLRGPNEFALLSAAVEAQKIFKKNLPDNHTRVSHFFLSPDVSADSESRKKVASVLMKLLTAKRLDEERVQRAQSKVSKPV